MMPGEQLFGERGRSEQVRSEHFAAGDCRVVALGDVGGIGGYHVGDEAMFEAALDELRIRGITRWTALSGDPVDTAARYDVDSIPLFGFASLNTGPDRDARLRELLADPRKPNAFDRDDPAVRIRDALAGSSAAIVTGGGNLDANWPHHVYERAALVGMAKALGVRVVVTGQGIGPNLDRRTGELVSSIVGGADLMSLRDRQSLSVVAQLGHDARHPHLVADDAAFLAGRPRPDLLASLAVTAGRFVAATFGEHSGVVDPDDFLTGVAALLDVIAETVGLPIVLLPHHGRSGTDPDGDVGVHARLAGMTDAVVAQLPVLSARDTWWLTGQAALVVANRYHPIVFGMNAAVPCVGLAVDEYTHRKISGALELSGMGEWCLPSVALADGLVETAVAETWTRRQEIAEHLAQQHKPALTVASRHWDAVAGVILGRPAVEAVRIPEPTGRIVAGHWAETAVSMHRWSDRLARRDSARRRELDDGRALVSALEVQLREGEDRLAVAQDRSAHLQRIIESEQTAAEAARDLAGEALDKWSELRRQGAALDHEIASLTEQLADRDAQLGDVTAQLAVRTDQLAALRWDTADVDRRVAGLTAELSESVRAANEMTLQGEELDALNRTKLLRWTRTPRKYYSMVRRGLGLQ